MGWFHVIFAVVFAAIGIDNVFIKKQITAFDYSVLLVIVIAREIEKAIMYFK